MGGEWMAAYLRLLTPRAHMVNHKEVCSGAESGAGGGLGRVC